MTMRHMTTWELPKEGAQDAMTISRLLPNDQNLLDLQESTCCIAVRGLDDVSLQLGSNSEEAISLAIAKVNTLLKYYVCIIRRDQKEVTDISQYPVTGSIKTFSHILNAEGEQHLTELRFLAHVNENFLKGFLLDRTKHRLRNNGTLAYQSVFSNGCVVRMMPFNYHQGVYQPAPDPTIVPMISRKEALELFAPFKQYDYVPKMSNWLDDNSSNSTTSVAHLDGLYSVNPQAAPNVAAWAKKLPVSEDRSNEATLVPRQELISWSQAQPSEEATGSTAYESAISLLAGLEFTERKENMGLIERKESEDLSDGEESEDLIDLSPTEDPLPTPLIHKCESGGRVSYSTMRQKAPSRKQPQGGQDEEMIDKISNKLVSYVEPLRIFQGNVTLKAQLVRFVLNNMHISKVSISDNQSERAAMAKTAHEQEKTLDDLPDQPGMIITNIISYRGGDMNYVAGMYKTPLDPSPMWEPKSKRVFYEFRCMTTNQETRKNTRFIIEVDAEGFTYHAYMEGKAARAGSVFVHCMKRDFDVQFDVNSAVDLSSICGGFASELISSLAVRYAACNWL